MAKTSTPAHPKRRRARPKATGPAKFDATNFLSWFGSRAVGPDVEKGATVFRQGEDADALYYVEEGKIQVAVTSKQGKIAIVAELVRGDFFGEACLAGQTIRVSTASATSAGAVARIAKPAMVRMLLERPDLSQGFTAFLLSRATRMESDLVDQMFNSSERRLARLLLSLADFGKAGDGLEPVLPKISQEVLAARVGTTRSRISYFMNKFRRLGYIEYNGTLKVRTSLLNIVVSD